MRDAKYVHIRNVVEAATVVHGARHGGIVVARQDHDRHPGRAQSRRRALQYRGGQPVVIEGVTGEQQDVGADRARRRQHPRQPGGAIAAVRGGRRAVIHVQVGAVHQHHLGRCVQAHVRRLIGGFPRVASATQDAANQPGRKPPMPLLREQRGHVVILTLSRPEARNAWCEEFQTGLREALPALEADPSVRCVVLTGDPAGGAFSAGADLKNPRTHTMNSVGAFIEDLPNRRRGHPINMLADFAKPVIAAVNGYAIGIGCIVTYCCDLIVASEQAEWRLPQSGLGIIPAQGGAVRLARWVGKGLAMRAAFGFPLTAEEAFRTGLAQWLVPPDRLMEQAMAVAEHIAALPPLAARLTKESLNFGMNIPQADAALVDLYRFAMLEMTEDKAESHQAWRDRRRPRFTGR